MIHLIQLSQYIFIFSENRISIFSFIFFCYCAPLHFTIITIYIKTCVFNKGRKTCNHPLQILFSGKRFPRDRSSSLQVVHPVDHLVARSGKWSFRKALTLTIRRVYSEINLYHLYYVGRQDGHCGNLLRFCSEPWLFRFTKAYLQMSE